MKAPGRAPDGTTLRLMTSMPPFRPPPSGSASWWRPQGGLSERTTLHHISLAGHWRAFHLPDEGFHCCVPELGVNSPTSQRAEKGERGRREGGRE